MPDQRKNDPDRKTAEQLDIDTQAPGEQGKHREFGLAGDARDDRAPGDSGRGDLSDADRVGSHGQGIQPPDAARDAEDDAERDDGVE